MRLQRTFNRFVEAPQFGQTPDPLVNVNKMGGGKSATPARNTQAILDGLAELTRAGRGTLLFPDTGTYQIASTIVPTSGNITIAGSGNFSTILQMVKNGTSDLIQITNIGGVRLQDLILTSTVNKTGGAGVKITNGNTITLARVHANDGTLYDGYLLDGGAGQYAYVIEDFNLAGCRNRGINVAGATNIVLAVTARRGIIQNAVVGIEINNLSGGTFENIDVLAATQYGVKLNPGNGQAIGTVFLNKVQPDTCGLGGFYLTGSGTGGTHWVELLGCWGASSSGAAAHGFLCDFANTEGVILNGCEFINNQGAGVVFTAGTDFIINGCLVSVNSMVGLNSFDGILIGPNVSGFQIVNSRSGRTGPGVFPSLQKYGIEIAAGCDNYVVTSNNTLVNATGGILNTPGAAATRIVTDNL